MKAKKLLTSAVAFSLVLTATVGTAFGEFTSSVDDNSTASDTTASSGSISAGGLLDTAAIKITVPTSLNFAIDPLELAEKTNINCADLKFTNAGDSAVKISTSTVLTGTSGVTFATDADDVDVMDLGSTEKKAYVGFVVAKESGTFDTENPAAVKALGTTAVTHDFLLAKTDGATEFKFFGKVTPNGWQADDITATINYTVTPISDTVYKTYTSGETSCLVANTLGLVTLPKKANATTSATSSYTAGTPIIITVTPGQTKDGTAITYKSLTSIEADGKTVLGDISSMATVSADKTVITLPKTAGFVVNQLKSGNTRYIQVTYSDGTKTLLKIVVS